MTALEARLAQPDGVAVLTEMSSRVDALAHRLRGQMLEGVPRAEFADWQAAADAVAAAGEVLRNWPVGRQGMARPADMTANSEFGFRREQ